jgi:hypothetical protein
MQLVARGAAVQPYEVTPTDVLWLMRAVQAEGPVYAQVAWILVNGFVWNRAQGSRDSLTAWVRKYAQPVNPLWFESGEKLAEKLATATSEAQRTALVEKARTRERILSTRTKFSEPVQRAVHATLTGAYQYKPQATDYAKADFDASVRGYVPLAVITPGQNRPWRRPGAEDWEGFAVAGAHKATRFPWSVLFLGAGLAGAAYLATLADETKGGRA